MSTETRNEKVLCEALCAGLFGACTLTLIHETGRRILSHPPRMDVIGMRAVAKSMRGTHLKPPSRDKLHRLALTGDLLCNSLYYSLVAAGRGKHVGLKGALLGAGAGVAAVALPRPLGLGDQPDGRHPATRLMTVAWYLTGGLAAAAGLKMLRDSRLLRA